MSSQGQSDRYGSQGSDNSKQLSISQQQLEFANSLSGKEKPTVAAKRRARKKRRQEKLQDQLCRSQLEFDEVLEAERATHRQKKEEYSDIVERYRRENISLRQRLEKVEGQATVPSEIAAVTTDLESQLRFEKEENQRLRLRLEKLERKERELSLEKVASFLVGQEKSGN